MAVPFFFITTGYLTEQHLQYCEKYKDRRQYIIHKFHKYIKLFAIWLLIYFPITIIHDISQHYSLLEAVKKYVISVAFKGESVCAWPLWYLYACIYAYALLSLILNHRNHLSIYLCIFSVLYFISYLSADSKIHLANYIIHWILARPLGGGIYIAIGMVLYRYSSYITKLSIIFLVSLSAGLMYFKLPTYEIVGGAAFFMLALRIKLKPKQRYLNLRVQSMWVFFIHMYVIVCVTSIIKFHGTPINTYAFVFIVILISSFVSYAIFRLSRKNNFQFLNALVS